MNKELSPLEHLEFIRNYEIDDEHRTLNMNYACKQSLDIIENALKNYEELTNKPVMLYGRTHEKTQALIDTICKNYKEVKITNLEDEKKLRALEIVKENIGLKMSVDEDIGCLYVPITKCFQPLEQNIVIVGYVKGKDKIDLLKEVLL